MKAIELTKISGHCDDCHVDVEIPPNSTKEYLLSLERPKCKAKMINEEEAKAFSEMETITDLVNTIFDRLPTETKNTMLSEGTDEFSLHVEDDNIKIEDIK